MQSAFDFGSKSAKIGGRTEKNSDVFCIAFRLRVPSVHHCCFVIVCVCVWCDSKSTWKNYIKNMFSRIATHHQQDHWQRIGGQDDIELCEKRCVNCVVHARTDLAYKTNNNNGVDITG